LFFYILQAYLGQPLDDFVKTLPVPVKIFRNKERMGLMRSRLVGAEAATGDTMTFLDAHIECTDGWLPPLLTEIKHNRYTFMGYFSVKLIFEILRLERATIVALVGKKLIVVKATRTQIQTVQTRQLFFSF
jgi:hypothetical protein